MSSDLAERLQALTTEDSVYNKLSNFDIDKVLGRGQFSVVYSAKCKVDGCRVALKKVKASEMDSRARFDCIREVQLLQKLDHPNVISYLASFVENEELYIVLEIAEAGDLSRMIKYFHKQHRMIPERTIWKYFVQICRALDYMHSKRVMHRDLKPANIFVTAEGIVKIGDLGLGRYFSNKTVAAHTLVGTPYYMSPERIRESGYSFKSDIWSLGCLLYELAALQSPFFAEKNNLFSLCTKIEHCDYPPIPHSNYSRELSNLVTMCMSTDPAERADMSYVLEVSNAMLEKLTLEPEKYSNFIS